jgi:hypothetical protein
MLSETLLHWKFGKGTIFHCPFFRIHPYAIIVVCLLPAYLVSGKFGKFAYLVSCPRHSKGSVIDFN